MINAIQSINISSGLSVQGFDQIAASGGAAFKNLLVDSLSQLQSAPQATEGTASSSVVGDNLMKPQSLDALEQTDAALGVMMQIQDKLLNVYHEIQDIRV